MAQAQTKPAEKKPQAAKKQPAKKVEKEAPKAADKAPVAEARAYAKYIRTSPRKLNLVAQSIRGKSAGKALVDLDFSARRIAIDVKKVCNRLLPTLKTTTTWTLIVCMLRKRQ